MLLDWDEICYHKLFGIADYESMPKIRKFKMADPICWTEMEMLLNWDEIWYSGFFGITNLSSKLRNSIWRIQYGGRK